jgi:two-component system sensor histidine kinase BarA
MPNLSGLEAAKLISKESTLNKDTPIILISANSCDLGNKELKSLGIDLCLQKPINEEALIRHLLSVIDKKKLAINWPLCVEKLSGNKVLAREFLDRFVDDLELNRNEFIQLMKAKNILAIEQAAHKLHGACCFCGVPILQKSVANLESLARKTKNINDLKDDFNKFIKSLEDVIHEYNNLYKERELI